MCRGQGSSCLHKAVHGAWGPRAACLSPGCTTPGEQGPRGTGGSSTPAHPVPSQEALSLVCAGKGLAPNSAPTPCSVLGLCKDLQLTLSPGGPWDPPHLCRAVLSQDSESACGAWDKQVVRAPGAAKADLPPAPHHPQPEPISHSTGEGWTGPGRTDRSSGQGSGSWAGARP